MILLVFSIGWSILVALAWFHGCNYGMNVEIHEQIQKSYKTGLKNGLERAEMITGLKIIEKHNQAIMGTRYEDQCIHPENSKTN